MLTVKVLMEQGIEVTGVCFISNFFNSQKAKEAAKILGVELMEIDISKEILELVKNPASGYGKNLNPCIDCHALMVEKTTDPTPALSLARRGGEYDIIATGEVLEERPFSQNKQALVRVQKLAGVEVLRPLSAKLLLETEYEKKALVDRKKLLDISGRSRQKQMELAKKYGINKYPSPAGGCLLTDPEFSQRLIKMLEYWKDCSVEDVELLKNGRIYWITLCTPSNAKARQSTPKALVVVGRNKEECERLEKLKQKDDIMVEIVDENGPTSLIRIKNYELRITNEMHEVYVPGELKMSELKLAEEKTSDEILKIAAMLTGYYASKLRGKKVKLKINN